MSSLEEHRRVSVSTDCLPFGNGRQQLDVALAGGSRVLIVGGTPFEEEMLLWRNFVARRVRTMLRVTSDQSEVDGRAKR